MSQKITLDFSGAEFIVEFDYIEPVVETFHQPGCAAGVDVLTVAHGEGLMNQFFENLDLWDQLEEVLLEKIK